MERAHNRPIGKCQCNRTHVRHYSTYMQCKSLIEYQPTVTTRWAHSTCQLLCTCASQCRVSISLVHSLYYCMALLVFLLSFHIPFLCSRFGSGFYVQAKVKLAPPPEPEVSFKPRRFSFRRQSSQLSTPGSPTATSPEM